MLCIVVTSADTDIKISEWTLIQKRGQYGNPKDFFSSKLWEDYVTGFGDPEKGELLEKRMANNCLFLRVLARSRFRLRAD